MNIRFTLYCLFLLLITSTAIKSQAESSGMLIEIKAGGKNPAAFCIPELSFINQTIVDIGALIIDLEWKNRQTGEVLQAAGNFGTMVNKFSAGKVVTPLASGHVVDCNKLELVVGTYACRGANAVRMPCPAKIVTKVQGGISINLAQAKEGPMKGVVEPR